VTTANYAARKFGIKSAMPISEAWRRCPTARFVYPRFSRYHEKSEEVFGVLREMADAIEPGGIDEGYLDVTRRCATFGDAVEHARALQGRVLAQTGLTVSLGVAANKLVAKIATDMRKPMGITAVTPGTEEAFLAPLSVRKIPGVGPKTEERLAELGVTTCAELAAASASLLTREFGVWGPRLAQLARGVDDSPVETGWERKSLGSETTFLKDEADPAAWEETLRDIAREVAQGLREEARLARTVTVKIRLTGFETHTRARTLARPTDDAETLADVAIDMLHAFAPERAVRLLGLRVTGLAASEGAQVSLDEWPADVLGEAEPWRPAQRRLDG
jgi:DNA polymerase-4